MSQCNQSMKPMSNLCMYIITVLCKSRTTHLVDIVVEQLLLLINEGRDNVQSMIDLLLQALPLIRIAIDSFLPRHSVPIGMSIFSSSRMSVGIRSRKDRSISGRLKRILRRDSIPALLQHIPANRHRQQPLLQHLLIIRALLSRPKEIRNNVDPLVIETRDMRLDLVLHIRRNLALERGVDTAEDESKEPLLALRFEAPLQQRSALDDETGHQRRARHVEIGEIGRVGLVHIEIELHDGRAREEADGLEDLRGRTGRLLDGGGYEIAMLEEVAVDAQLKRMSIWC